MAASAPEGSQLRHYIFFLVDYCAICDDCSSHNTPEVISIKYFSEIFCLDEITYEVSLISGKTTLHPKNFS
ncbi:MAG: hypothetical protein EOM50_22755 [Erysipelotrichia bacterium]|nr:hypothetical protein [Erysipelotrichia bacterium]